jgi:hypothetical protein
MLMHKGACYVQNLYRGIYYIWVNNNLGQWGEGANASPAYGAGNPWTLYNGGQTTYSQPVAQCNSEIGNVKAGENPGKEIYNYGWNSHFDTYTVYEDYTGRPGIDYT